MHQRLLLSLGLLALCGCQAEAPLGYPGPGTFTQFEAELEPGVLFTVYLPDGAPGTRHPVVIFSTGWNQPRISYTSYGRQLAQWGFIAIIRHYPSLGLAGVGDALIPVHVDQVRRIMNWCEAEDARPSSPLYQRVDPTAYGTTGHSMGGGIAIGAAIELPRVQAAVPLDILFGGNSFNEEFGAEALAGASAAILYLAAEDGRWCSKPPQADLNLFDIGPPPAMEVVLAGAGHIDFVDFMSGINNLAWVACPAGEARPADVRALATRYMVAWFQAYLQHDAAARAWLADAPPLPGVAQIRRRGVAAE